MQITNGLTDDAALAELGFRLARARLARNLTQQQLADQAGVSVDTVRRLERRQSITLTALLRLLRARAAGSWLQYSGIYGIYPPIYWIYGARRRRARPAAPAAGYGRWYVKAWDSSYQPRIAAGMTTAVHAASARRATMRSLQAASDGLMRTPPVDGGQSASR